MVAAGAGNIEWFKGYGSNAGALIAEDGITDHDNGESILYFVAKGPNQTGGGKGDGAQFEKGNFGIAGYRLKTTDWGATGGGGYYGGTSINGAGVSSGGSSFISGYDGCDAVLNNPEQIIHTGKPFHYSGYVFSNPEIRYM